ncbi:MAG: hypothetical protein ABW128_17205 [Rhizorhabdus sp.]
MTAASNEVVAVIQADREAAWSYRSDFTDKGARDRDGWMAGQYDANPSIQAFARHRIAHSDPRPVAEGLREALEALTERSEAVVAALDKYNADHGTHLGGAPFFKIGVEIAHARQVLATHSPAPMAGEGTPQGTFTCPICGKDTPHYHSPEEVERHRETEAWVEESWQQARPKFFPDGAAHPSTQEGDNAR